MELSEGTITASFQLFLKNYKKHLKRIMKDVLLLPRSYADLGDHIPFAPHLQTRPSMSSSRLRNNDNPFSNLPTVRPKK